LVCLFYVSPFQRPIIPFPTKRKNGTLMHAHG
jgi:hypothetical protein